MIFTSSDYHLFHRNVIKFDNRPDKDVDSMNKRIFDIINEYVKENDIFVYLGDFCLPYIANRDNDAYIDCVRYCLDQIRCKNIIFVAGNHDKSYIKQNGYYVPNYSLMNLFSQVEIFGYKEHYHFGSYELRLTKRICSEHNLPKEFSKCLLYFSHYSHRVWNKSHRNKWNLGSDKLPKSIQIFGHSHGGLPPIRNSIDVGFNIWNRPLSIIEIVQDLIPKINETEQGQIFFPHHYEE